MDGEERFLREVRETALAQGSERPGGHVPPRAAPGQRSGFRVPSLRLGVPPLPTAAQKTCMALRSSLEKIRKAHGGGGGILRPSLPTYPAPRRHCWRRT